MKFIILLFITHTLLFSQEVEPEILKTLEDKYNSKYRVLLSEEKNLSNRNISSDTVAPKIQWEMDCEGVVRGYTQDYPDNEVIRVGLSIPDLLWDEVENFQNFKFGSIYDSTFIPGTPSCTWSIEVVDTMKYAKAIVIFYDRSNNFTVDTLEYRPFEIEFSELEVLDNNNNLYEHVFTNFEIGKKDSMRYELINNNEWDIYIDEFTLKNSSTFFNIVPYNWDLSDPIKPGQTKYVDVYFQSDIEGNFEEEIGVKSNCKEIFFVKVKASTGFSGISVHNCNFIPQQTNGISNNSLIKKSNNLKILNKCKNEDGTKDLVIKGYTGPFNDKFKSNLPFISEKKPLIIKPNESFEFNIEYSPNDGEDINDSIIFHTSDNLECDNICSIFARGINSILYLYNEENGNENTDIVDFGTITKNDIKESQTKKLVIGSFPRYFDYGKDLIIYSIDWGEKTTTDISKFGEIDHEFYINEEKLFEDLGVSDYPLTIEIGEKIEIEVEYFSRQEDNEHLSTIYIESDADQS